jgi:ketosteroid isomerase-like protein
MTIRWAVFAVLFLRPLGVAAQEPVDLDGPGAQDVRDREVAFAQTMADRDFDAFMSFIAPDAVFFNGNRPLRGPEEIAADWRRYFEGPEAPFSWTPDLVQVLESGGLALSSGPVTAATGATAGRFNSVWRRDRDGVWRVIFDKGS